MKSQAFSLIFSLGLLVSAGASTTGCVASPEEPALADAADWKAIAPGVETRTLTDGTVLHRGNGEEGYAWLRADIAQKMDDLGRQAAAAKPEEQARMEAQIDGYLRMLKQVKELPKTSAVGTTSQATSCSFNQWAGPNSGYIEGGAWAYCDPSTSVSTYATSNTDLDSCTKQDFGAGYHFSFCGVKCTLGKQTNSMAITSTPTNGFQMAQWSGPCQ